MAVPRDDGAEVIIGVFLNESEAEVQTALLREQGIIAAVIRAEMGDCGCGA